MYTLPHLQSKQYLADNAQRAMASMPDWHESHQYDTG